MAICSWRNQLIGYVNKFQKLILVVSFCEKPHSAIFETNLASTYWKLVLMCCNLLISEVLHNCVCVCQPQEAPTKQTVVTGHTISIVSTSHQVQQAIIDFRIFFLHGSFFLASVQ